VCAPWFLTSLKIPDLRIGDLWCRLSHSIPIVIILVSSFSIMMISIDRWMFVVFARQRQLKSKDAIIIIFLIWSLSVLLAGPMFYHRHMQNELIEDSIRDEFFKALSMSHFGSLMLVENNFTLFKNTTESIENYTEIAFISLNRMNENNYLKELGGSSKEYCVENWSYHNSKRIYVIVLFFLEFILPCITMITTYIWIIRFLKNQQIRMLNHDMSRRISSANKKEKSNNKNCLLLTSLCLSFIFCSLPLSLFNILLDIFISLNKIQQKEKAIYWLIIVLTTLELLNIVISPLLYGWMNRNFRTELFTQYNTIRNKFNLKSNEIELSIHTPLRSAIK
jgi:hypothetical protein